MFMFYIFKSSLIELSLSRLFIGTDVSVQLFYIYTLFLLSRTNHSISRALVYNLFLYFDICKLPSDLSVAASPQENSTFRFREVARWVQPEHIVAFSQEAQSKVTRMWVSMYSRSYPKSVWVHINTKTHSGHRVSSPLCTLAALLKWWLKNLTTLPPLIFTQCTDRATIDGISSVDFVLLSLSSQITSLNPLCLQICASHKVF